MSFLSGIWNGVTAPFRAIGQFAQGNFRQGLGDLGQTAEVVAPILGATGVGLPLAAGIGAAGGGLSTWGQGDSNVGDIVKGAVRGGAEGAAGSVLHGALGGGGGAPAATTGAADLSGTGSDVIGGAASELTAPAEAITPSAVSPGLADASQVFTPAASAGASPLSAIGAWAKKNPVPAIDAAGKLLGTGAQVYGAQQLGSAEEVRLAEQKREFDEQERRSHLSMLANFISGMK